MTRCQVCGRRLGIAKAGGIAFHNVAGVPCAGVGFAPIEEDDARLRSYAAELAAEDRALSKRLLALYDARANYIPPELTRRLYEVSRAASRLNRRIARLDGWPARFDREMERQGWGSPPPAYLLARACHAGN